MRVNKMQAMKGFWIDSRVLLAKELNSTEKLLLTIIQTMQEGDDGFKQTNRFLATMLDQSDPRNVSKMLSKFTKLGLTETTYFGIYPRERIIKVISDNISKLDVVQPKK